MPFDPLTLPPLLDFDPIALMQQENRAAEGVVPQLEGGWPREGWRFGEDWFALDQPGLRFFYRRGAGVTWQVLDETQRKAVPLYLSGSVYAAAASLSGLYPLHVSAVLHAGRVHAFGGPSGAGKSTITAALAARGYPLVADDTMLLYLGSHGAPQCLPGHKRLKLVRDAFKLTGAAREEVADGERDKFYARAIADAAENLYPLASITFLETSAETGLYILSSGQRVARLQDDHYTAWMFDEAQRITRPRRFALQARIAENISMAVLGRPKDPAHFPASLDLAVRFIETRGTYDSSGN